MKTKALVNNAVKIVLPLAFGGAILYWMYRDFDFRSIDDILMHGMDWTWMLLSFPFGILAQMFRGWRWRQNELSRVMVSCGDERASCRREETAAHDFEVGPGQS